MKVETTQWEPLPEVETGYANDAVCDPVQPGFGLTLGWNVPARWWEPFAVLTLWKLRVSVGWLYG